MENKELARREVGAELMEQVVIQGDLSKLTAKQRVEYYGSLCRSLGLNPLTKPFDYITLNGRLVLYAKKDCTDQIRANRHISIAIVARELVEGVYVVTAKGTDRDGRADESIGAVAIDTLKGDARANALMKAETKAKRRVTLSLGGLGWLDETELETIPDAAAVTVSAETGEIEVHGTTEAVAPEYDAAGARRRVAEKRAARVTGGGKMSREDAKEQHGVLQALAIRLGLHDQTSLDLIEGWRTAPWTQERLDQIRGILEAAAPPVQAALDDGPPPEVEAYHPEGEAYHAEVGDR